MAGAGACSFDKADRWIALPVEVPPEQVDLCTLGALRCTSALERCDQSETGPAWTVIDDCAARGLVCAGALEACAVCQPQQQACVGQTVMLCDELGATQTPLMDCDPASAEACRNGTCVNLCTLAADQRSNVGCEYWAVDLDNAVAGEDLNAAAQQFAVVVSNPQPDLPAEVSIQQDDTSPGSAGAPHEVARQTVPPYGLVVFPLGPREVDGSPPGEYNTGTNTALTRAAYRVTSDVPVVAYQFNPLENVNVFSNDASLLKPVEALTNGGGQLSDGYVVLGWPQTISSSDDPYTNFGSTTPQDFRAFLTVAATRPSTRVRITSSTRVVPGGPIASGLAPGEVVELTLDPYDVLNLETGDFEGDFTGSIVASDQPVAVFSGSEASDAPRFTNIANRRCCADHLEEQLDPVRSAGQRFIAPVSFNRHLALANAGAPLEPQLEPENFRVIAVLDFGATVRTSLDGELAEFRLEGRGSWREITTTRDFWMESDNPVMLGNITASQAAAGIPSGLPGGDPSFIIIPPIEQFRAEYVFLTPDRYSFDFLRIMTPRGARIILDTQPLESIPGCGLEAGTVLEHQLTGTLFAYDVIRCQLSFPVIDTTVDAEAPLLPGVQNDGVHRVFSDRPIGVIAEGFDRNVSYGYAAGTELREIVVE